MTKCWFSKCWADTKKQGWFSLLLFLLLSWAVFLFLESFNLPEPLFFRFMIYSLIIILCIPLLGESMIHTKLRNEHDKLLKELEELKQELARVEEKLLESQAQTSQGFIEDMNFKSHLKQESTPEQGSKLSKASRVKKKKIKKVKKAEKAKKVRNKRLKNRRT